VVNEKKRFERRALHLRSHARYMISFTVSATYGPGGRGDGGY